MAPTRNSARPATHKRKSAGKQRPRKKTKIAAPPGGTGGTSGASGSSGSSGPAPKKRARRNLRQNPFAKLITTRLLERTGAQFSMSSAAKATLYEIGVYFINRVADATRASVMDEYSTLARTVAKRHVEAALGTLFCCNAEFLSDIVGLVRQTVADIAAGDMGIDQLLIPLHSTAQFLNPQRQLRSLQKKNRAEGPALESLDEPLDQPLGGHEPASESTEMLTAADARPARKRPQRKYVTMQVSQNAKIALSVVVETLMSYVLVKAAELGGKTTERLEPHDLDAPFRDVAPLRDAFPGVSVSTTHYREIGSSHK